MITTSTEAAPKKSLVLNAFVMMCKFNSSSTDDRYSPTYTVS